MNRFVYATRRSKLALAQSRALVATLAAHAPGVTLDEEQIVTTGDRIQDRPLSEVGGKGLFVKEIEEALLEGRASFAVHSIKDVPAELPHGLAIVCVPPRVDARDVLVSPRYGTLDALPQGATLGTSSLRRAVALSAKRPDLRVVPLRGNVDTRLRKVDEGECDAIVLARAGLLRLELSARATEILEPEVSLPAVGQGALGIEARLDDAATLELLARVHDEDSARCVGAERGVMTALDGNCKTPLAAYAMRRGESLWLRAFVADPDGARLRQGELEIGWSASPTEAEAAGRELGARLARG